MQPLLSFGLLAMLAASAAGNCVHWTPWINADNNYSGKGDFETVGYNNAFEGGEVGRVTKVLEKQGIICSNPIKTECRVRHTGIPWYQSGDYTKFPSRINCETRGLACDKSRQADGRCADYEVRLLCWQPCAQLAWTGWSSYDRPGGSCDCENPGMVDNPTRTGPACPDGGSPYEIQCQTTRGIPASLSGKSQLRCDVGHGFSCFNNKQANRRCHDYRVRFLCNKQTKTYKIHKPVDDRIFEAVHKKKSSGGIIPDIAL